MQVGYGRGDHICRFIFHDSYLWNATKINEDKLLKYQAKIESGIAPSKLKVRGIAPSKLKVPVGFFFLS